VSVADFAVTVVQIKKPLTKKVVNTMLCTTWGCKNTPKTPQFWGGVPEFLCTEVQFPLWKYDMGCIFKATQEWRWLVKQEYVTTLQIC
jgi:hypothetical protein